MLNFSAAHINKTIRQIHQVVQPVLCNDDGLSLSFDFCQHSMQPLNGALI